MRRIGLLLYPLMSRGGVFVWANDLAKQLSLSGVEVHVLVGTSGHDVNLESWDWSSFASVTFLGSDLMPRFPSWRAAKAIEPWLKATRPDVLVGAQPYMNVVLGLLGRSTVMPKIASVHAYPFGAKGLAYQLAYLVLSHRWAASVFVSSDLLTEYRVIRSERKVVAPPTVRQAPPRGRNVRVLGAKLRVLYVGRLEPEKGVADLPMLLDGLEGEVELRIAGTGSLQSQLERALPTATFLGWVEDPHLCYSRSDILIHPSPHEGFGLVLREALSAGLTTVSRQSKASEDVGIPAELTYVTPQEGSLILRSLIDVQSDAWPQVFPPPHPGTLGLGPTVWSELLDEL